MTRGRSRGNVRHYALWVIRILVLVPVRVVGLVWLGVPWTALRPSEGILCSLGDATWASPVRTAITRVGVGLWYREVGSLGAKG